MDRPRDWVDYATLLVSACTLLATVLIAFIVYQAGNKSEAAKVAAAHYQTCYDNQFKLAEAVC